MKTAEEIIAYMEEVQEKSLAEHKAHRGIDAEKSLLYIIKATVIAELLEDIKG